MESSAHTCTHNTSGWEKLGSERRLPKLKRAQEHEASQLEELRCQEVRLLAVRQELQMLQPARNTPEESHGRETVQVHAVRKEIRTKRASVHTPAHTHWGEALPLPYLWKGLHSEMYS